MEKDEGIDILADLKNLLADIEKGEPTYKTLCDDQEASTLGWTIKRQIGILRNTIMHRWA